MAEALRNAAWPFLRPSTTNCSRYAFISSPLNHLLQLRLQLILGEQPDDFFHHLASLEEDERGDRTDAISRGRYRVFVHVNLGELHPAAELLGAVLHYGGHHLAGTAPRCPEVHQDGDIRLDDLLGKVTVTDLSRHSFSHGFHLPLIFV